ncbi:TetR/AcrR family transcriptional regulator [Corynebacterium glyciniphilum]|uniref:TetR/AcrR family transcriptional regulator n=1 Tax=Corynebacterium glyciniphilum TaxID=1404244 RepID=UPI003FD200B9
MTTKKVQAPQEVRRGTGATARAVNQRADAQRNRERILSATPTALRKNPDASVAEIAAEAGVGRMTLYGHFSSRRELIEVALIEGLERGDEVLSQVQLNGAPDEALSRLVASSWMLVNQSRALLMAAQKELPASRIRDLHTASEARMRGLLERGQEEGVFRTDLPVSWLLTTVHVVMNGAAEEIAAGRLAEKDAPRYINAILGPAFAVPPSAG